MAADSQAAQEMVQRTGQMGVPVTLIGGQTIIGFNQPALLAAVVRLRGKQPGANEGATLKLGAQVADGGRVLAQQGHVPSAGALIGKVQPGLLAGRAGLREGDIVVKLAGQVISSADDLAKGLQSIAARRLSNPDVLLWRDGAEMHTRLPVQFG